jgi:hypothetical protein
VEVIFPLHVFADLLVGLLVYVFQQTFSIFLTPKYYVRLLSPLALSSCVSY